MFVFPHALLASGYVSAASSIASSIELTIDYGNTTKLTYTGLSGGSVFDVLNETANITFTEFAYGRFIVSINGVENNAGSNGYYWQYWVNDELGPIAADNFILENGDQILWRYCAPAYQTPNSTPTDNSLLLGIGLIALAGGLVIGIAFLFNRKMR
ncbi:MAG: DUF4430 domain-containing protein [Promethearchaeota archaeon]